MDLIIGTVEGKRRRHFSGMKRSLTPIDSSGLILRNKQEGDYDKISIVTRILDDTKLQSNQVDHSNESSSYRNNSPDGWSQSSFPQNEYPPSSSPRSNSFVNIASAVTSHMIMVETADNGSNYSTDQTDSVSITGGSDTELVREHHHNIRRHPFKAQHTIDNSWFDQPNHTSNNEVIDRASSAQSHSSRSKDTSLGDSNTATNNSNIPTIPKYNSHRKVSLPSDHFNDEIAQITDCIFIGDIRAGYDEPLLCRLRIKSMIDMSNLLPEDVPRSKIRDFPCMCASQYKHTRSRLNIQVRDSYDEDLMPYFEDINGFIEANRKRNSRVLLFCYSGKSSSPTAVIQYLMHHNNMRLQEAYDHVKRRFPSIDMNRGFWKTLELLDKRLHTATMKSV